MPFPTVGQLYQQCLYFPYIGDNLYGQPMVGPPVQMQCRWNTGRTMMTDPKGNQILLDAQVILFSDVLVNSQMWLGKLIDWNGTGSATDKDTELMVVKVYKRVFDSKARWATRTAGLMRKSNSTNGQG